ncbi:ATP-dependent nuclease [Cloacibacterium caeni]|uniref:ATP-dependent nuclease n=1 Tax=Cloacibacterium caeni TaxID=2004710 RepID=UPI001BCAA996|nr:AAA family ATPase [Cloacibacterium caeni]
MGIRLESIRIKGFRGFRNIEMDFENTSVLVGANNSGKTTILKALQIALTNTHFISNDDFFYCDDYIDDTIIIDVLFKPIDAEEKAISEFDDNWSDVFKTERIGIDSEGNQIMAFRTIIKENNKTFRKKQYYIDQWESFIDGETNWYDYHYESELSFYFDEIPFVYIEANRDILDDIKSKSSYLGRILSSLEFTAEAKQTIEKLISELNTATIDSSAVLTDLQKTLMELDTAMDNPRNNVQLTPFTKKIRDLNKGIRINYSEFSMDYHGMGTRSWSSMLVLKSFLNLNQKFHVENEKCYFPIIAIEEPESHLHPNAQKKLYRQINDIVGQKIISTHSNYIASNAKLNQIRSLSKINDLIKIGKVHVEKLSKEELRQINRQVINTRGELFFSKVVVLFEGETEEQSLPLLVSKHFGYDYVELGVNFIGVGGAGNYLPFIRFCEAFNIEYLIFSDNEPDINTKVLKQISQSKSKDSSKVVFVSTGNDFEKELCEKGYLDEVKLAYHKIELEKCNTDQHKDAKKIELGKISNTDYYEIITKMKTECAPEIAIAILSSSKPLPDKIIELFEKVKNILNPTTHA